MSLDMTSTEGVSEVEEQEQEELAWDVDDPEEQTHFDEDAGCLKTTMPSGIVIGWDICGCGGHVTTCGCEPITLPRYVLRMREREQHALDEQEREAALAASLSKVDHEQSAETSDESRSSSRGSQRSKKKTIKKGR
jgi:hypothetical protein